MHNHDTPSRQRGAALFVSLIALVVLTLIALTAANSSSLEMLMATNSQNAAQALANAEDSALTAERDILTNHNAGAGPSFDFDEDATDGYYTLDAIAYDNVDWTAVGAERPVDAAGNVVAEYTIEYLGTMAGSGGSLGMGTGGAAPTRFVYRVTGRGTSDRGTTRIVQTIFATQ